MDPIVQGLQVSVLGLIITFLALGVFILVMVVLKWLFPNKEAAHEEETAVLEEPEVLVVQTADDSEEGQIVAAIAAGLNHVRAAKHGQLGDALTQGRGSWWKPGSGEKR